MRADAGARVKRAREKLGLTGEELGVMLGYDNLGSAKQIVSQIERGIASPTKYMDAAGALGLSLMDLIEFIPHGKA